MNNNLQSLYIDKTLSTADLEKANKWTEATPIYTVAWLADHINAFLPNQWQYAPCNTAQDPRV